MNKTRRRKARARRSERQGKLVGAAYLAERDAHRQACHIKWVKLTDELLAEHERLHQQYALLPKNASPLINIGKPWGIRDED